MSGLLHGTLYGLVIVNVLLVVIAVGIWFERKFAGRMQSRLGPTLVGPVGLLQPFADVFKLIVKEDLIPAQADRALFNLAPPQQAPPLRLGRHAQRSDQRARLVGPGSAAGL